VRRRLEGICAAAVCNLKDLDVHVITAATLRMTRRDRERLEHTIAELKPRLLILDPFVRLHRIDENTARGRALLAYFVPCNDSTSSPCSSCITPQIRRPHARRSSTARLVRVPCLGDSNLYLRVPAAS